MHNVILLHGHGGAPESFWLPYIRKELEKRWYSVWSPQLPNNFNPNLGEQLPYLKQHGIFNSETIIIAHSASCPLVIALLEGMKVQVRQVILVAAFISSNEKLASLDLAMVLKENYDWSKIQVNTKELIVINSNNDPFGCDVNQAEIIVENTGGTLIVPYGEGHFGSKILQQPYREFPLLLRLIV